MRDYPGMPLGKVHQVLCVACSVPATTLYAYDDRRCGSNSSVRRQDGSLVHVSCTNEAGNKDCGRGVHYDRYVQQQFEPRSKLRNGRSGQTGRP